MQLALSLTQKNTKADASNAKYCKMFQDVRFTFAILSSCMCSKQEYYNEIFTWLYFYCRCHIKMSDAQCRTGTIYPAAANSANFVEKSTTLQNFCKLPSGIHHIAEILKITMKNQPHCTNVGNYYERSAILHNFSQLR